MNGEERLIEISNRERKTYCGIADAHGLESFIKCDGMGSAPMTITMRAQLNRQRHAMVYWVTLSDKKASQMSDAIKVAQQDGNWHTPLLLLKNPDFTLEVAFEDSMKDSWSMLPNDRLDPYWSAPSTDCVAHHYEEQTKYANPCTCERCKKAWGNNEEEE